MKKHVRLLSLVLSMVLLLITAAPAFAVAGIPEHPYTSSETFDNYDFPDAQGYEYSVTITPVEFSSSALRPTYYSVYHSGHYDNLIEFTADDGAANWTADGDFRDEHKNTLWSYANYGDIVQNYSSEADYFYMEITTDYPKGEYTLHFGCFGASLQGIAVLNGQCVEDTTITWAPYRGTSFICVDY